jgi:ADP-ribosylglycohydrolase
MSSTGRCFDIGNATRDSLNTFERRQKRFSKQHNIPLEQMDSFSDEKLLDKFQIDCSEAEVAGNGALMRLAPVPLFFYRFPEHAIEFSGRSGQITHGDMDVYNACRYYGALIVAALHGYKKDQLLDRDFYSKNASWFGGKRLYSGIQAIAEGSYQRAGGYNDGIRGKGYIVDALEAALWAFWSDGGSFEKGALAAVNLGDDTDTTAAIYGQLAGAYYGYTNLPQHWVKHLYAKKFILNLSKWIVYEGQKWQPTEGTTPHSASQLHSPESHPEIKPSDSSK